ncbi:MULTISPECIES: hypothetical protein [unclassified Bradyrhizobium]|uniref:hypothetical protein n=1 Tax=unclassified Bradyrhizobium TaxID=2631580 RepID=UPI0003FC469A|nr:MULTISPECIES: hypothetical protein [unclassified Bradyrhizobium]QIG97384.1 hypothetical protein G6P99_36755 [Bradyrhizobium sp. 6(2017)]
MTELTRRRDRGAKLNDPFLREDKATPTEYTAGLKLAIAHGWLGHLHESGTFTRMTQLGKTVFGC